MDSITLRTRIIRTGILPTLALALGGCVTLVIADAGDAGGNDAPNATDVAATQDARDASRGGDVSSNDVTSATDASGSDSSGVDSAGGSSDSGSADAGSGNDSGSTDAGTAVLGCATAPVIMGDATSTVAAWSRVTGMLNLNYYGHGYKMVDMTHFETIWSDPMAAIQLWPGRYGEAPTIPLPVSQYVSAVFTVPDGYLSGPNAPATLYGEYFIGETDASAPMSMTISQHCGDFGQFSPTTVVPGCVLNLAGADSYLLWEKSGTCALHDGETYYLNIINADISQMATTGRAISSQNDRCLGNVCTDPVENGPGSWGNYVP